MANNNQQQGEQTPKQNNQAPKQDGQAPKQGESLTPEAVLVEAQKVLAEVRDEQKKLNEKMASFEAVLQKRQAQADAALLNAVKGSNLPPAQQASAAPVTFNTVEMISPHGDLVKVKESMVEACLKQGFKKA